MASLEVLSFSAVASVSISIHICFVRTHFLSIQRPLRRQDAEIAPVAVPGSSRAEHLPILQSWCRRPC